MTERTKLNVLNYAAFAGLSIAVGLLTALLTQLNGDAPINWRPVTAAMVSSTLGVLTMMLGSMKLTRVGRERIAEQVDVLKQDGIRHTDMIVMPRHEVAAMVAAAEPTVVDPSLSPDEMDQLLTLIRTVTPQRAIVLLNDDIYREAPRTFTEAVDNADQWRGGPRP